MFPSRPATSLPASFGELNQRISVDRFLEGFSQIRQSVAADEAGEVRGGFGAAYQLIGAALPLSNVVGCFAERLRCAGVEPVSVAVQDCDVEGSQFPIFIVHRADLDFAPGAWLNPFGDFDDSTGVEVDANDGVVRLWLRRLLLDGDCPHILVKLYNTEVLGVGDVIGEHRRPAGFGGGLERLAESLTAEDVVAKNERDVIITDKLLANDESLGDAFGLGLYLVRDANAQVFSITKQALELVDIVRRCDDQDVFDTGRNQIRQGIVDGWFVIGWYQRLADANAAGANATGGCSKAGAFTGS